MAQKYLDYAGLQTLWTKIKAQDGTNLTAAKIYADSQVASLSTKIKDGSTVAKTATNATNATNDSDGKKITDTYIKVSQKATNGGVATLGADGKIPSSQLPSYVDDVLEYDSKANFPTSNQESGKIYVDKATNKTYRWGGSDYVLISASLALGETADTAYSGIKGKTNADNISKLQGYFDGGVAKETYKLRDTSGNSMDYTEVHNAVIRANRSVQGETYGDNDAKCIVSTSITDFKAEINDGTNVCGYFEVSDVNSYLGSNSSLYLGYFEKSVGSTRTATPISENVNIYGSDHISLVTEGQAKLYLGSEYCKIGTQEDPTLEMQVWGDMYIKGKTVMTEDSMTAITTAELNTLLV